MIENEQTEFKLKYTDNIIKEVVAFLNTNSGNIFIGFDDNGNLVGLKDAKSMEEALSNKIKSMISPDPSMFISINHEILDNKDYIVLKVNKGVDVYYLTSKGLVNGVYTRVGSSSMPASQDTIKELLVRNKNISYESTISLNQNLTFDYSYNIFKEEDIDILDVNIQKNLHLKNSNGMYTNLAKLLSDQNDFSFKVAVYQDESKRNFIDNKEFKGSLLEIYDKVTDYLKINSAKYGIITDSVREDIEEYPEFILRELLLNSLIHRSYDTFASNIINIYQNEKIEILSVGGLYNITLDAALAGLSVSRNPILQSIFMRLRRVEAIGSGLRRVNSFYREKGFVIEFEVFPTLFKVSIPRISVMDSSEKQNIVNYIRRNGVVGRKDLNNVVKKERTTIQNLLKELLNEGVIKKIGDGPATKYMIK